jgi:transcriptional regulator with XRE-family HTH domain
MTARNKLLAAPPHPVEQALERLGENLRTARLRRNLTVAEVAERIGTGPRAVAAAEAGKASTGIAIYAALLWAYGLLDPVTELADPAADAEGLALALQREPKRARARAAAELDDDF